MPNFNLLTNLISKANCYDSYIYVYALGIILGIIISIIIRVPNDGGQEEEYRR
jgi:hypothetical protein